MKKKYKVSLDLTGRGEQLDDVIATWRRNQFNKWGNYTAPLFYTEDQLSEFIESITEMAIAEFGKFAQKLGKSDLTTPDSSNKLLSVNID